MHAALPLVAAALLSWGSEPAGHRPRSATVSDTCAGETVELETRDKLTLDATYFPTSKRGKAPAVVMVHDSGSSQAVLSELAEYLQRKGLCVLTIDLRGHGASRTEEVAWDNLTAEREQAGLWSFAAGDVRLAVDWLRRQDGVHPARVGVVGVGAGGSLAVAEALDDRDTNAVALIAPRGDNHGFNLARSLGDLAGLPTLVLTPDEARQDAERLQSAAHRANGGETYVTVTPLKTATADVLADKRLAPELAKWLKHTLEPAN